MTGCVNEMNALPEHRCGPNYYAKSGGAHVQVIVQRVAGHPRSIAGVGSSTRSGTRRCAFGGAFCLPPRPVFLETLQHDIE